MATTDERWGPVRTQRWACGQTVVGEQRAENLRRDLRVVRWLRSFEQFPRFDNLQGFEASGSLSGHEGSRGEVGLVWRLAVET
jgi:hypothetical protein